jgi:hypothetical protein
MREVAGRRASVRVAEEVTTALVAHDPSPQPSGAEIWDLLIFLALVAVGLVVLNLLARRR